MNAFVLANGFLGLSLFVWMAATTRARLYVFAVVFGIANGLAQGIWLGALVGLNRPVGPRQGQGRRRGAEEGGEGASSAPASAPASARPLEKAEATTGCQDDQAHMGSRFGMVCFVTAFATLAGPPSAAAIVESAGYTWAQVWAGSVILLGAGLVAVGRVLKAGWKLRVTV